MQWPWPVYGCKCRCSSGSALIYLQKGNIFHSQRCGHTVRHTDTELLKNHVPRSTRFTGSGSGSLRMSHSIHMSRVGVGGGYSWSVWARKNRTERPSARVPQDDSQLLLTILSLWHQFCCLHRPNNCSTSLLSFQQETLTHTPLVGEAHGWKNGVGGLVDDKQNLMGRQRTCSRWYAAIPQPLMRPICLIRVVHFHPPSTHTHTHLWIHSSVSFPPELWL